MQKNSYTRYPRPLLWLIRGGTLTVPGEGKSPEATVAPFYISKAPITNSQFEAFDPSHVRSRFSRQDEAPVAGICYTKAVAYCRWYAAISRKPMRLPTEVEWEYACRGVTSGRNACAGESATGGATIWHAGNSGDMIRDPREKMPNTFGLHGMLGTVWEWTSSIHGPTLENGAGDETADLVSPRVLRGGSFRMAGEQLTCSLRQAGDPATGLKDVGFRVVRSFP